MVKKSATAINPYTKKQYQIYAYTHDERQAPNFVGHIKVGETTRDIETRVNEQTKTAGFQPQILFHKLARKNDGTWFKDTDLHRYFEFNKIKRSKETGGPNGTEWFDFKGREADALKLTEKFIEIDYDPLINPQGQKDYILRAEQSEAVTCTFNYFHSQKQPKEFLWNAKPRFGKTLTTYDFIRKIQATNVLILCNRPAIANSWFNDFDDFISWRTDEGYRFVSESSAIKRNTMSYHEYENFKTEHPSKPIRRIAFVSLQDFKGAKFAGGPYEKLAWMQEVDWDVIILDEAHEAIDTPKSQAALNSLRTKFTLHLSGTPFKTIASEKFREDQIFNWSYHDEQKAKNDWNESNGSNPYARLPQLNLFTYKMSEMMQKELKSKIKDESSLDSQYAFDLGEFFRVGNNHKFVYEQDVKKFLDLITQGKYPFSSSEQYVNQLDHTFWLLPSVAAAKALKNLLNNHEFFKNFEIVLAVGKGSSSSQVTNEFDSDLKQNKKSFNKVREAIDKPHSKTITLSVGQLTTGVTVPEWTGALMLRNIGSASLYFQSAFRVQNPHEYEVENEQHEKFLAIKDNAYIFDFAPDRTLKFYDDFANGLLVGEQYKVNDEQRRKNIQAVLNFFPVIAEDSKGSLCELNIDDVLTIPTEIKSEAVVKSGFMNNFLFANINNIFRMPNQIKEILDQIEPIKNKKKSKTNLALINNDSDSKNSFEATTINQSGVFGKKIVASVWKQNDHETLDDTVNHYDSSEIIAKIFESYQSEQNNVLKNINQLPTNKINKINDNFKKEIAKELEIIEEESQDQINRFQELISQKIKFGLNENDELELNKLETSIQTQYNEKLYAKVDQAFQKSLKAIKNAVDDEAKKKSEDAIRDHLRGFTRTIPIYLMVCDDKQITLANYETKTDPQTFQEISSITAEQFRLLKNGCVDENGKVSGFFNEVIFNNSIQKFYKLKNELANYFDETINNDIFNFIPTQKTNQVFTPKKLVKEMVDKLEETILGLFTNKTHKFLDPYCKSGLYLAEIIKRLYIGLQNEIVDEQERIKWIFENQIYGICPSDILVKLVSNYLSAGRKDLVLNLQKYENDCNFKNPNWFSDAIKKWWGDAMKFDVIIGNPPYQEKDGGAQASASALYQYFVEAAFLFANVKYVSLITPSRWMTGGKGLDDFRARMLENRNLMYLYDYCDASTCFPDNEIKGGG